MALNYLQHLCQWPVLYRNQWKTPGELVAMQERAMKRLIAHAYARVPYYRRLFDSAGIDPTGIASLDDLQSLPLLTKDVILANYPNGILASGMNRGECSRRMTSGSSGKKLEVVLDYKVAMLYRLMQFRQLIDIGYQPWDTIAYVRYSPPITSIMPQRIGLFRRSFIPLEWEPERQAAEIVRTRPRIVNAYPSVLYLLAKTLGREDGSRLDFKFLMSNSELLTAHAREYIEDVFRCKVYDDYSCLEFSAIAFECRMQNLHVAADNVILEVLDESGNRLPAGEPGRIVLTSLNNYSMPYIRYEIGDVGVLSGEECPCGRCFPVLKAIVGRCDDFLVLPSGQLLDPQTVVFQIETIPEVREFRVVQQEDRSLTVNIVPQSTDEFQKIREEIRAKLHALLGGGIPVEVIEARSLDRGSTGKHRSVLSQTHGIRWSDV
ncbi:MAG: Phenylacetate-coenzyme A ligase [Syntrophorhabdus sp. PtaB.Bin047]|nr:MAG: Phenylacetate-coenzyme A ligase [Syntrophorhabdus sp. PtaB.Bin047]